MAVLNLTGLVFSDTSALNSRYGIVGRNTTMLFYQATAPVGWAQTSTWSIHDNKALRVVSGLGSAFGGTNPFTSTFPSTVIPISTTVAVAGTVGDTTLTLTQIASHAHGAGAQAGPTVFAAGPATPSRYLSRSPISYTVRAFYNKINNYQQPSSYRQPQTYQQPSSYRQPQAYRSPTNVQNPITTQQPSIYQQPSVYRTPTNQQNPTTFRQPNPRTKPVSYQNPISNRSPTRTNQQNPVSNPVNQQNPLVGPPQRAPTLANAQSNRQEGQRRGNQNPYGFTNRNRNGGRGRNRSTQSGNRRETRRNEARQPRANPISNPIQNPFTTPSRRPLVVQVSNRSPARTPFQNPVNSRRPTSVQQSYTVRNIANQRVPLNVQNPKNKRTPANKRTPLINRTPTNLQNPLIKRISANKNVVANTRIVANKNVPIATPVTVRYPQVNSVRYEVRTLVPGGQIRGANTSGPDTSLVGGDGAHAHPFTGNTIPISGSIDLRVQYIDVILCYFE